MREMAMAKRISVAIVCVRRRRLRRRFVRLGHGFCGHACNQQSAADRRCAACDRAGGPALRIRADGHGRRWRHADLQDREPSGMGDLQSDHRQAGGHATADGQPGVPANPDQRFGRQGHQRTAGLRPQCSEPPVGQCRAHDRWPAGNKCRRRQLLRIHPAGVRRRRPDAGLPRDREAGVGTVRRRHWQVMGDAHRS